MGIYLRYNFKEGSMILTATLLIATGVLACLLGTKLFKLLLPLFGLVTGFMVGFLGFQGVFGSGAVSTAMAIVVALTVGLVLAVLSYVFFDLAVTFLAISVGAIAFSYLGVALGLNEDGFIVFLLALAGAILAGMYAVSSAVSVRLVVLVTSFLGVAYILTGVMLLAGEVSLDAVHDDGAVRTLLSVVDQSFLWFFVWLGGSLFAASVQQRLLIESYMTSMFEYTEADYQKSKR